MLGHLFVGGIQDGDAVLRIPRDTCLEVVADQQTRNTAKELERMDMRLDPGREFHIRHGLRVAVHAEWQYSGKEISRAPLAGSRIP